MHEILRNFRNQNRYAELLLVSPKKTLNPKRIDPTHHHVEAFLQIGYLGYFEEPYVFEVLWGYIKAAFKRISNRINHTNTGYELNERSDTVQQAVSEILKQLRQFANYDRATFVLLSERDYIPSNQNRFVRSIQPGSHMPPSKDYNWHLLRPIKDDPLIKRILDGSERRLVFDHPKQLLGDLWEDNMAESVYSWIALPLFYLGKPIALITLDATHPENIFTHGKVNEVALSRFINQAALSIRAAQERESSKLLKEALDEVGRQNSLEDTLTVIAQKALELVDGLFCHVAIPNEKETVLEVRGAYSRDHGADFIHIIKADGAGHFDLNNPSKNYHNKKSISARAFEERKIILLDDCRKEFKGLLRQYDPNGYYDAYMDYGYNIKDEVVIYSGSNIVIPIRLSDHPDAEVLGIINVEHKNPAAFTDVQIKTLQEFALLVALAVRRHIFRKQMFELMSTANEVGADVEQSNLIHRLAQRTCEIGKADAGVKIFVRVDNKNILVGHSDNVEVKPDIRHTRALGGHTDWVIENNQVIAIESVIDYDHKRALLPYGSISINDKTVELGHNALLCLPIQLNGHAVGAMWMHYTRVQRFTLDEIAEFQLYANRMAVMLNNDTERKLLRISEEISVSQKPEEVADLIVRYVRDSLDAKGVVFYVNDVENRRLFVQSSIDRKGERFWDDEEIGYDEGGLAVNMILAQDKGLNHDYSAPYFDVPDYTSYRFAIDRHISLNLLESLTAVRLQTPHHEKPLGVIVVIDELGRTWTDTRSRSNLLRFARLAASLLALVNFRKRDVSQSRGEGDLYLPG